jgi:DNA-binding transcriptional MerR regulator/methylmalonyl-CoA mutase cobalamin-binding subunit
LQLTIVSVELRDQDEPRQSRLAAQLRSLAAAERDTGLSRATLLDWERRYGFPCPTRDAAGQRVYPADQIERLQSIRQALEAGQSPGEVVPAGDDEHLRPVGRVGVRGVVVADEAQHIRSQAIAALRANDVGGLQGLLRQALGRWGLGRFVQELISPLNVEVGDAWMQGRIEIFQEHLYTEAVQGLLRHALQELPVAEPGRPLVLLATASGEGHGLGLLMAEAVLSLAACRCHSLGVQTPIWDIARAAMALEVDVVALSYTGAAEPGRVADELSQLRQKLPGQIDMWVGGSSAILRRQTIKGLWVVPDLGQAARAAAAWRDRQGPASTVARSKP